MTSERAADVIPPWAGLCATCGFARAVTSARGSTFVLCERSKTESRYRRYPMLPVVRCDGHGPVSGSPWPTS